MVISASDSISMQLITDMLISGKLVIMPCDTIYGILGICPDTEPAITGIKGRSPEKAYIRLVGDIRMLRTQTDSKISQEILDLWPGPLTLIVTGKDGVKTGIRIPEDERLLKIISKVGSPLFSTSVNESGTPPLWRISEIIKQFRDKADLIVDGGDLPGGVPSTVFDITTTPKTIIRQGSFIIPQSIINS